MSEELPTASRFQSREISRWTVSNFKSVGSAKVNLEPGHLTVLTGANSVGKSSLVQSILMLCQSVNNGGDIVLNGDLTKLGIPSDVVRDGESSCTIEIEFTTRLIEDDLRVKATAVISMVASQQKGLEDGGSLVVSNVEIALGNGLSFRTSGSSLKRLDTETCLTILGGSQDDYSLLKVTGGERGLNRTYVAFRGLQPVTMIKLRSENESINYCKGYAKKLYAKQVDENIPSYIYEAAAQVFNERGITIGRAGLPFLSTSQRSEVRKAAKALRRKEKSAFVEEVASRAYIRRAQSVSTLTGARSRFETLLMGGDEQSGGKAYLQLQQTLSDLQEAMIGITSRVEYIGPLRDDPRVVSPMTETSVANLPIGRKGEKAAAVLLSKARQQEEFGLPDASGRRTLTLADAVNVWADYLGVARGVRVSDMQKLGVSLHVTGNGAQERDLTTVGVGASQAIPILVGVLGAKRGSIVIIEQPELHLHPSAQARLADFFLRARPDLTILVESHSEALITRLRRRVVEDEVLTNRISILFFERDEYGSAVTARTLSIDEYGNLEEWPKGFMDAVQEDSRAILKAGIAKRKRLRSVDAR